MNGGDNPSRAGRLSALAALAASATMFISALAGIASIDPTANAATRTAAPVPVTLDISREQGQEQMEDRRDCPWRQGRDGRRSGFTGTATATRRRRPSSRASSPGRGSDSCSTSLS